MEDRPLCSAERYRSLAVQLSSCRILLRDLLEEFELLEKGPPDQGAEDVRCCLWDMYFVAIYALSVLKWEMQRFFPGSSRTLPVTADPDRF